MGKSTTTDNVELLRMGYDLLGGKFRGVFASDENPALSKTEPYAIINTKPRKSGGEHWVAIALTPSMQIMHYDSFGRSAKKLFPGKFKKGVIDTEDDVEQRNDATNCGQRSLAWLLVFDKLGTSAAKRI